MDEELRKLLQKNLEISQESLKILKKMQRARMVERFFSILKWILIIAISLGSYYYIEPIIQDILGVFQNMSSSVNDLQNVGESLGAEASNLPSSFLQKIQGLLGR